MSPGCASGAVRGAFISLRPSHRWLFAKRCDPADIRAMAQPPVLTLSDVRLTFGGKPIFQGVTLALGRPNAPFWLGAMARVNPP